MESGRDSNTKTDRVTPSTVPGRWNRRRVVKGAAIAGAAAVCVGAVGRSWPRAGAEAPPAAIPHHDMMMMEGTAMADADPVATWAAGEPLVEPEVRRSVNGELRTTLRVQYAYKDAGSERLFLRTYDGMIPGPTLRCLPGDVLRIRVINDLPPNRDQMPTNMNHPHQLNTTNLHTHGLHVSPSGIADNVLRDMDPGGSYDVEIPIPDSHTRGTAWYHPHRHGSADIQVASGMAGALIIDGDFAEVPEIAQAQERVLVINQVVFDSLRTIEGFETTWPEGGTRFYTVNGQREPAIAMRPGEVQNWRFVHAGYQEDALLELDGHDFHPIAYDGIALSTLEQQPQLLMAPGQRAQVLVRAGAPGTYELHRVPNDQGYPSPTGPLARVVVSGEPLEMGLPGSLPPGPLAPIGDDELTGTRQVTLDGTAPEVDAAGSYQEFGFLVDGRPFDENRVDQRIPLGAVEEWTVTNLHLHDHVFHIHTNPFLVTKVNEEPLATPVWRDTVIVPRHGSVTFRSRFVDFTGRYVLHCHMMNHEDLGMMQLIEVYDPN